MVVLVGLTGFELKKIRLELLKNNSETILLNCVE
jgi:hypothetical protein